MSLKMNSYSRTGLAICLALGLTSSGCASWNRLIGKKEEPSPKLNLAWSKLKEQEGNFTSARHGYEQVLAKDPNNVEAVLGMARLNLKAQRLVEAEEGFKKAVALKPKSTEVLTEIGNFYSDQQQWDKAIPLLQECQRLEPHEKTFQFNLAVALAKSGKTKEALPHFKEAVGDAAAHYNLGRLMIEKGNRTEAEEQFVLALAKDPKLSDAQFFLDELRANNGKAQQLPAVVDAKQRENPTQQVAATAPEKTAELQNPFEEAPASGFSRSNSVSARPVKNVQSPDNPGLGNTTPKGRQNRAIPSGRQPVFPHEGYEELAAPPESDEGSANQNSASAKSYASSIIQASAEEPATDLPQTSQSSNRGLPPRRIVPHRLLPVYYPPDSSSGDY